jgi:predicted nucleic acid-binding protein
MSKYLLDVNALIALHHVESPHHMAFHRWAASVGMENLNTCAMVELGFLRVSMQAFRYSAAQATLALAETKASLGGFVGEAPSPLLPAWAETAGMTSDAYLAQVAREAGLVLATFDRGIPGAYRIG